MTLLVAIAAFVSASHASCVPDLVSDGAAFHSPSVPVYWNSRVELCNQWLKDVSDAYHNTYTCTYRAREFPTCWIYCFELAATEFEVVQSSLSFHCAFSAPQVYE
jgi:hypothetical protein